jgi:acyl-CoA synthetase (AMP-forming)/AMP-acid ligase II
VLHTDVIVPVPQLLAKHARERPAKAAFTDAEKTVTYAELDRRTSRLAGHLLDAGLHTEDRLLMYLDNSIEVVEGYLVAPRAGIVTVCANPIATTAEFNHILQDSDAVAVLTDATRVATVMELAAQSPSVKLVIVTGTFTAPLPPSGRVRVVHYNDLVEAAPHTTAPDDADLDAWCWMLYTSGTTGRPKGVHLTQRGCLWVVGACWIPIAGLCEADVAFSALPLFHSYALDLCVLAVMAVGATEHIATKFSPDDTLRILREEPITFFPGVPTMFRYLLNAAGETPLQARALRLCVSAGALMPSALNEAFEAFASVPLLDGYGITETSTMVTMNSAVGGRVLGSCGLPLPGLTVRLVDPTTNTDVAPFEEGEIWVEGPNVMAGYHNLPDATAKVLTDGWYRTGDLARRDENGFLRISGRLKELIIRGGENIYPAEIEDVLMESTAIADVAVVAKPHDELGEVPVAFLVLAKGSAVDEDALRQHCRSALSYYKVPTEFIAVQEIPRTGSGKIQRHKLLDPEHAH